MATAAAGMAGALWLAVAAIVGAAVVAVVAVTVVAAAMTLSGLGLDPPTGGGEEWRTLGLKLCPPRVLTCLGRRREGDGGNRRRRISLLRRRKDFEMKMKREGGGVLGGV